MPGARAMPNQAQYHYDGALLSPRRNEFAFPGCAG
jgi:hypothetical protein